jgi:hypothetical protein
MDGWLQPLNKSIYPPLADYRKSRPAPGCPRFGGATVLARPDYRGDEPSVKPGLVEPQRGGHSVVWWDPAVLRLNVEGKLGLRNHDILGGDSPASARAYHAWRDRRGRAIEAGRLPEWEIAIPSEAGSPPGAVPVEILSAAPLGDRPGGRRFGTLVHLVLRDAGFNGSAVERLARAHACALGAPPEESDAAADAALTALGHPLLQRARRAERCFRELPVTLKLAENRMVEGSIDLAFLEDGAWHVVDFKTDAHQAEARARYERQLQWYAAALAKVSGQPVTCHLLGI